jgi:hypothetical protein
VNAMTVSEVRNQSVFPSKGLSARVVVALAVWHVRRMDSGRVPIEILVLRQGGVT